MALTEDLKYKTAFYGFLTACHEGQGSRMHLGTGFFMEAIGGDHKVQYLGTPHGVYRKEISDTHPGQVPLCIATLFHIHVTRPTSKP